MSSYTVFKGNRLIPARAGNTATRSTCFSASPAHPRSRGEHQPLHLPRPCSAGSSPLARGTRHGGRLPSPLRRLIPARAGNTGARPQTRFALAAHPRSRGEHLGGFLRLRGRQGSSPLARGTHLLTWGFTPYISKIESLWSQSLHPEYTINSNS